MKTASQSQHTYFFHAINERFRLYKELAKSGIVTLVVISVTAGFFISHRFESEFPWQVFLLTFFGILLLASGSSAMNQIQEIETDKKMPRTQNRPLPTGKISLAEAVIFSLTLIFTGLTLLYFVSSVVFYMGWAALFSYNILYTLWWKKLHAFAAIPGAIPGALPIYMGSVAANGEPLNPIGIYLFLILFIWQMPHFWVLALRYKDDYSLGGIPTLPVELGKDKTLHHINLWALAYIGLPLLAPLFIHNIGVFYVGVALITSLKIIYELWKFQKNPDEGRWIHFFLWVNFSLIIYLAALAINHWSIFLLIPILT